MVGKQIILGMIVAALFLIPGAAADEPETVGISGECYNEDGSEGGGGDLGVNSDGTLNLLGEDHNGLVGEATDPNNGETMSIVEALAWFGTRTVLDQDVGNTCNAYECSDDPNAFGTGKNCREHDGTTHTCDNYTDDGPTDTEDSWCYGKMERQDNLEVHVDDGNGNRVQACYVGHAGTVTDDCNYSASGYDQSSPEQS